MRKWRRGQDKRGEAIGRKAKAGKVGGVDMRNWTECMKRRGKQKGKEVT